MNAERRLRAASWVAGSLIAAGLICVAISTRFDVLVPAANGGSEPPLATPLSFTIPPVQPREIARITIDAGFVQGRFVEIPANTAVAGVFACTGSAPLGWSATADPSGDPIASAVDPSCAGSRSSSTMLTRQPAAQSIEIRFIGDPAPDTRAYLILVAS